VLETLMASPDFDAEFKAAIR
jgi:hypothetical protein